MAAQAIAAGVGAGINILSGIAGELWAGADDAERERLLQAAADEYGNVDPVRLQELVTQQVDQSAYANAPMDFGNRGNRDAAIQSLINEGLAGGNSLDAKAAQAEAQRAAGVATRQGQQTALANAAQRGMGGAAATLQAQLHGASTGADRAAQVGLQGMQAARQNALQALIAGQGAAAGAEQADSAADARKREAMDRIALFNAEMRSQTAKYNSGLAQQNWENQLATADRRAGAKIQKAGLAGEKADRKRRVANGLGNGLAQGANAVGGYLGGGK